MNFLHTTTLLTVTAFSLAGHASNLVCIGPPVLGKCWANTRLVIELANTELDFIPTSHQDAIDIPHRCGWVAPGYDRRGFARKKPGANETYVLYAARSELVPTPDEYPRYAEIQLRPEGAVLIEDDATQEVPLTCSRPKSEPRTHSNDRPSPQT